MSQETARRQSWEPGAAEAVRAYAARTRADADQLAGVLEDIAANGLPAVEDCTPWEEQASTRCTGQGLGVVVPAQRPEHPA